MIYDDILNNKEIKNPYQKIDRYNIKNNNLYIKFIHGTYSILSSIYDKEYYISYLLPSLDKEFSIYKNDKTLKRWLKDMEYYKSFNFNVNIYIYIFQDILDER